MIGSCGVRDAGERDPVRYGTVPEGEGRMLDLVLYIGRTERTGGGRRYGAVCCGIGYAVQCNSLSSVRNDHIGAGTVDDESSGGGGTESVGSNKGLLREYVSSRIGGDPSDLQLPKYQRDVGDTGGTGLYTEDGSANGRDSGIGPNGEVACGTVLITQVWSLGPDFSGLEIEGDAGDEIVVVLVLQSAQSEDRLVYSVSERELRSVGDMQKCP